MPARDGDANYIIDTDTGLPYKNEFVYYKSGGDLYRRVLANATAFGNTAVSTCPPEERSAQLSAGCQTSRRH